MPHVPWKRLGEAPPRAGRDWRALAERLLGLTYAVAELTLPVLSKPQVGRRGRVALPGMGGWRYAVLCASPGCCGPCCASI